jgi:hypothetical protein
MMKTIHTGHGGKLSVARILSGSVNDGTELTLPGGGTARVSGIYRMLGKEQTKLTSARIGDTVALWASWKARVPARRWGRERRRRSNSSTERRHSPCSRSRCGRRSARTK